jgi:protein dithiol oxidoreductase (disulfide-forming)
MKSWRGILAVVLALPGFCLALAAGAAELQEGRDYRVINPPLAAPQDRIEVTEFFWYGCPHCFELEPALATWIARLPAGVGFRRVPAIPANDKWLPGARLYYTLEAMDLVDKLHGEVFAAIHVDRQRLDDEKSLFEWAAKKGIDSQQFAAAWSSPGVQSRVRQARLLGAAAGLTGVPAVMVHGRYLALARGNHQDLLAAIDQLVARVRSETGMR